MNREVKTMFLVPTLLVVSLLFYQIGFAESKSPQPIIEYVYPDQSVWTTKTDASGVLDNPLLRLADQLFQTLGREWIAKPYPANRMFQKLETGESNFSMLVRAPRLFDSCIFSTQPVVSTELRVYRSEGSSPIGSKEDLKGEKVITIRGYSYGKIGKYLRDTENNVVIFEAARHEAAFGMLANGRAKYLLDYKGPSEEVLQDNPIPGVASDTLKKLGVYLVLSKTYPDASKFMEKMEKTANTIDVTQWGLDRP